MSSTEEFQSRASRLGAEFRERCKRVLEQCGFTFQAEGEELESVGIKVELVYMNKADVSFFIEVSGTEEEDPTGQQPGLERSDSVKKIICNAFLAQKTTGSPTLVMTSHLPAPESAPAKMMNAAGREVIFDVICINKAADLDRLRRYAKLTADKLDELTREDRPIFTT